MAPTLRRRRRWPLVHLARTSRWRSAPVRPSPEQLPTPTMWRSPAQTGWPSAGPTRLRRRQPPRPYGTYQLTGLAPGIYSLSISDDEHAPTVVSGVMATAGSSADDNASSASTGSTLTLTLSPAGGSTVLPAVLVGVEDSTGTVVRSAELGPARSVVSLPLSHPGDRWPRARALHAARRARRCRADHPSRHPGRRGQHCRGQRAGSRVPTQPPCRRGGGRRAGRRRPLYAREARVAHADTKVTPNEDGPPETESFEPLSNSQLLVAWIRNRAAQETIPGKSQPSPHGW